MNVPSAIRRLKITSERQCFNLLQKRFRYKKKWAVNLPSKTSCELALEHFDAFYKPLFGQKWPSIRVALLSMPKYAAVINNASDSEASFQSLSELGAFDLIQDAARVALKKRLYNTQTSADFSEASQNCAVNIVDQGTQDGLEQAINHRQKGDSDSQHETASERLGNLQISSEKGSLGSRVTEHGDGFRSFSPGQNTEASAEDLDTVTTGNSCESETSKLQDLKSETSKLQDLKSVLLPDALYNSSDLEHFIPSQQVFSEKEQLRRDDRSLSTFQERAISVAVIPGQLPVLPPSLKVMAFSHGDVTDFPSPAVNRSQFLNYYLLDAASVLPVIALDIKPHDSVLDLCAAPGGKTLTMLQMIISQGGHLVSNDSSQSRLNRLRNVLKGYFPYDLQDEFVTVVERNGRTYSQPLYKKVLVDVPCNSDRHVLSAEENILFKPGRIKDRLQMTTLQKDLLISGIKSCKPGGSVVYSTCTLAAVQNDGVVQRAVEELWETSDIDVAVEDLSLMREAFAPMFQFHSHTRLGQLILPSLVSNFGPMYFSKLKRLR